MKTVPTTRANNKLKLTPPLIRVSFSAAASASNSASNSAKLDAETHSSGAARNEKGKQGGRRGRSSGLRAYNPAFLYLIPIPIHICNGTTRLNCRACSLYNISGVLARCSWCARRRQAPPGTTTARGPSVPPPDRPGAYLPFPARHKAVGTRYLLKGPSPTAPSRSVVEMQEYITPNHRHAGNIYYWR